MVRASEGKGVYGFGELGGVGPRVLELLDVFLELRFAVFGRRASQGFRV